MIKALGFHELVRQAQTGDRQALDRLLAIVRPELERLASGHADPNRARESTLDLVQEGWLRVWQKLDQFRGAEDDERTAAMFHDWLAKLVRHLALDIERDRRRQRRLPPQPLLHLGTAESGDSTGQAGGIDPAASGPTPSANLRIEEQAELVRAALEKIADDTDREIVRLCFFEGMSMRQIAERLNLSYDKVRERHHASLRLLERQLKGLL